MAWKSVYDKDGSSKQMGDTGEINFAIEAAKRGCNPLKTESKEDKRHIDFWFDFLGKRVRIDTKARKAISRGGPPQDELILLEHKNVNGYPGWIHGVEEYVSFEQSDCWIIVPRDQLQALWTAKIDETKLAKSAATALYCIYSRPGRLDVIGYVKNTDVKALPGVVIWEKKNV